MKSSAAATFQTGFVTSKDGARISYRQMGSGPALILVPGGMQAAQNFMKLGTSLSDTFTVSILNRRGRSLSGPYDKDHSIQREVEDLDALLRKTGAQNVVKLKTHSEYIIPKELQSKLDAMPLLKTAFEALTPGRQRIYMFYISAPKHTKTRELRVEKCIQGILDGKGLND
jgi:Bacteriocin-protection, YdeI or OmpD-Associated